MLELMKWFESVETDTPFDTCKVCGHPLFVFGVVGREQALTPRRVLDGIRRLRGMPLRCFREIQRGIEGSDSNFPGKRNQLGRADAR